MDRDLFEIWLDECTEAVPYTHKSIASRELRQAFYDWAAAKGYPDAVLWNGARKFSEKMAKHRPLAYKVKSAVMRYVGIRLKAK